MTIASWEARVESFNDYLLEVANKLEERQYKKSKQAAKVYTIGKWALVKYDAKRSWKYRYVFYNMLIKSINLFVFNKKF